MLNFSRSIQSLLFASLVVAAGAGCAKYEETGIASVHAQKGDLNFCLDLAASRNPALKGQTHDMILGFEVAPDGSLHRFGFRKDDTKDAEFAQCISEKVKVWKFPPPPSGKIEQFNYEFNAHFR